MFLLGPSNEERSFVVLLCKLGRLNGDATLSVLEWHGNPFHGACLRVPAQDYEAGLMIPLATSGTEPHQLARQIIIKTLVYSYVNHVTV